MKILLPTNTPLRYEISDWRQLDDCLSNNSKKLHLKTTVFFQQRCLNGLRIRVEHEEFGDLFACVVKAKGDIVSEVGSSNIGDGVIQDFVHEFTPAEILSELEKYGFYITFKQPEHLSGKLLDLLMTINRLGYDKLRIMNVWDSSTGIKQFKWKVTCFNSEKLVDWINPAYSCSIKEYTDAVNDGHAFNVTAILERDKKHYDWTWLWNVVVNIYDVLTENTENLI